MGESIIPRVILAFVGILSSNIIRGCTVFDAFRIFIARDNDDSLQQVCSLHVSLDVSRQMPSVQQLLSLQPSHWSLSQFTIAQLFSVHILGERGFIPVEHPSLCSPISSKSLNCMFEHI